MRASPNIILTPDIHVPTAQVIIIMLDATKSLEQKRLLEVELDAVGIRLNKKKPDGGITVLILLPRPHVTHIGFSPRSAIQLYSNRSLAAG